MTEYDEIKGMLNKIRRITAVPTYGAIREQQQEYFDNNATQVDAPEMQDAAKSESDEDFTTINNVDIKIHSEDPEDLNLTDEEKGRISQLIDDFRKEVSEMVEFGELNIYENSAKLTGKISDLGVGFTLSAGDDVGLYLNNTAMLKVEPTSLEVINKLTKFQAKFTNAINDLLVNRKDM